MRGEFRSTEPAKESSGSTQKRLFFLVVNVEFTTDVVSRQWISDRCQISGSPPTLLQGGKLISIGLGLISMATSPSGMNFYF